MYKFKGLEENGAETQAEGGGASHTSRHSRRVGW